MWAVVSSLLGPLLKPLAKLLGGLGLYGKGYADARKSEALRRADEAVQANIERRRAADAVARDDELQRRRRLAEWER